MKRTIRTPHRGEHPCFQPSSHGLPSKDRLPLDTLKTSEGSEPSSAQARHLNAAVAITVALLATFLGICKVKDDNIVQTMQQAQTSKIDHWNFYQARNIREEVAKGTLVQLQLAATRNQPASKQPTSRPSPSTPRSPPNRAARKTN